MKKIIPALLLYLIIFGIFFFLSLYNYYMNIPLFEIGLSTKITNLVLIFFSFAGILKTAWHIITC